MEFNTLRQDKGVAGMNILIGLVISIFILAILVMSIALLGGELEDATDTTTAGEDIGETDAPQYQLTNETALAFVNSTLLALDDIACSLYNVTNETNGDLGSVNYTASGVGNCYVTLSDDAVASFGNFSYFNVSTAYTYSTETTASGTIENSTEDISSVTEWFTIFIVMGAIVVIMLLVAIIIQVARGFQGGFGGDSGSKRGSGNIGSA